MVHPMPHIRSILILFSMAVFMMGCAVMEPPQAQVSVQSVNAGSLRLAEIERRLGAIERMLATGTLVELTKQVDELQRDVAELRGRTDVLEYNTDGTTSRQRELYVDLDNRIRALEQQRLVEQGVELSPTIVADEDAQVSGVEPEPIEPPTGTDRESYEEAFALLRQGRYPEAGVAFQRLLLMFPQSQLKDNAQYWLAETYYGTGQFEQALIEFQAILSNYPRSRKIPDAMLKVGYSHYELEQWEESRAMLQQLILDYPGSTASRLASQRLDRLSEDGY
ncbi:MAG: tol-pal system protein YbgF [Woeseia sp.]|nr:tol-pal system protein YbgF [Woeseia sp.]